MIDNHYVQIYDYQRLIATFIDLFSPLVMKQIIDYAIPEKDFKTLFILIIVLAILPIIPTLF